MLPKATAGSGGGCHHRCRRCHLTVCVHSPSCSSMVAIDAAVPNDIAIGRQAPSARIGTRHSHAVSPRRAGHRSRWRHRPHRGWRRHRAPCLKADKFLLVQLIGRTSSQGRHFAVMGGRVSDMVRVMVHRRHRRVRSRRGRWRVAEKARIGRTGGLGSAWVRTGDSHRVSARGVPARSLRPNRRGDRKRGNRREAAEKMAYIHEVGSNSGLAPIVAQFGKDAGGNYGRELNRI
jgi:hypothetical protein